MKKRAWPHEILSRQLTGGTEKNHEMPRDVLSPGCNYNPAPAENESGLPPAVCSVL